MTIRPILSGAAGISLSLLASAAVAQDGAAKASGFAPVAVTTPQIRPVAAVEREDEPTCSRARRRLWLEGEGWVVRRVTTCR